MSYGDQDPETVKKMTVSHTSAIRLHQEIVEAQEAIRNLPCECPAHTPRRRCCAFACIMPLTDPFPPSCVRSFDALQLREVAW